MVGGENADRGLALGRNTKGKKVVNSGGQSRTKVLAHVNNGRVGLNKQKALKGERGCCLVVFIRL